MSTYVSRLASGSDVACVVRRRISEAALIMNFDSGSNKYDKGITL